MEIQSGIFCDLSGQVKNRLAASRAVKPVVFPVQGRVWFCRMLNNLIAASVLSLLTEDIVFTGILLQVTQRYRNYDTILF